MARCKLSLLFLAAHVILHHETSGQFSKHCPAGAAGRDGRDGLQGRAGRDSVSKGDRGDEGPQGPAGVHGTIGPRGATGSTGTDGAGGIPGAQGPKGGQGPRGDQGLVGEPGPQAPQGIPGVQGVQGPKGMKGTMGFSTNANYNIKQFTWRNEYSVDSGKLKTVTFTKTQGSSMLKVSYSANARMMTAGKCVRWFLTFNNAECTNPATIEGLVFQSSSDNTLRQFYFDGICEGLPRGDIEIALNVGTCPGKSTGDAYTGWKTTSRFIVEEIPV